MTKPRIKINFKLIFLALCTSDRSISAICKQLGYPFQTVFTRIFREPKVMADFEKARKIQADYIVQSIFDRISEVYQEIRTSPDLQRISGLSNVLRTQIDSIKWIACKYRPELYGDKLAVTHNVDQISAKFKEIFSEGRISSKPAKLLSNQAKDEIQISDGISLLPCNVDESKPV